MSESAAISAIAPQRRRVLWLSHFVPYPPKGGCFQRSYNLIKRVAAVHDVHLIAVKHKSGTHPEDEIREARTELLRHCKSVQILDISASTTASKLAMRGLGSVLTWSPLTVTIYRSAELRAQVRALVQREKIEAAHFDAISLADYLEDVGDVPTVMTHHGAESFMIRRRIDNEKNFGRKMFFWLEWHMLRRYEARMCPRFSMNVVMSRLDQEILAGDRARPPASRSSPMASTSASSRRLQGTRRPNSIVFAGRLDQYSNRHGMLRFMNEAWPAIRRAHPDAVIDVIGSNPPKEIEALGQGGCERARAWVRAGRAAVLREAPRSPSAPSGTAAERASRCSMDSRKACRWWRRASAPKASTWCRIATC